MKLHSLTTAFSVTWHFTYFATLSFWTSKKYIKEMGLNVMRFNIIRYVVQANRWCNWNWNLWIYRYKLNSQYSLLVLKILFSYKENIYSQSGWLSYEMFMNLDSFPFNFIQICNLKERLLLAFWRTFDILLKGNIVKSL